MHQYINQFTHITLGKLYFIPSVTLFLLFFFSYLFHSNTGLWYVLASVFMLETDFLPWWMSSARAYILWCPRTSWSNNENCCFLIDIAVNSCEKSDFTKWFMDYTKWFPNGFDDWQVTIIYQLILNLHKWKVNIEDWSLKIFLCWHI